MKNAWSTKKLDGGFIKIVFVIFAIAFFIVKEYWISLFSLALLLISYRLNEVREFFIGTKGLKATFHKKAEEIINSEKSTQEKTKATQDLIDEVFRAGYQAGGGKIIGTINNVKIFKDKEGNTTGVQYDEN